MNASWKKNAKLGRFTNFVNLLDLAAVAVPSGVLHCRPNANPTGAHCFQPATCSPTQRPLWTPVSRGVQAPHSGQARGLVTASPTEFGSLAVGCAKSMLLLTGCICLARPCLHQAGGA